MELFYFFTNEKNGISMVKQPKMAVNKIDKKFFVKNFEGVPWIYIEYEHGDEFLLITRKRIIKTKVNEA